VGAVIYPIALEKLIPQIGFGWSVRVVALIQLVTLAIPVVVMKSHLPPRKVGALVDFGAFLQPSYTLYTVGTFLAFWGLYTPFFYAPAYAATVNIPSNLAPYILSMMNVRSHKYGDINIRLLRFLVGYCQTLLRTLQVPLISSFPLSLPPGYFYSAGSEYQHGKDSSSSECYTVSFLEHSSVYLLLVSVPSLITVR
jgi:hypothetical protein